ALTRGGNSACVINAANEIAVAEFLAGNIGFNDIYKIIEKTLSEITFIENPDYQDFVTTNNEARVFASSLC
ncbi:MAG: 1-deoxy-D-xylulose-5-phosphate reductoisomerase, partial [Muribaculaceae bacterium]|nr:1-deoxy-D-xylulose-5-phosphate reductoisomerase [Muribaculaceae bacterium]